MYNKKTVFSAACAGMLFFGIGLITLGSVITGLRERFRLDGISTGTLFSILPFGILTGSLAFGPICDKYGYKSLLVASCVCMFIGFQGIAYAPAAFSLKICVLVFGFGAGAINGATNAVVADITEKEKGANLSLLGVFFGLGALGMPLLLGVAQHLFSYERILSAVGIAALLVGLWFLLIKFPPPKRAANSPRTESRLLRKDGLLLLISFFLFFQSGFEAIINNWTTTFISQKLTLENDKALYALSLFVAGMTLMRILLGSVLRIVRERHIWALSFLLIFAGLLLLDLGKSFYPCAVGLILLGGGLAPGFPIMLGYVGNRYKTLSATAFSIAIGIALVGNMIINYGMGIIVQSHGVGQLIAVSFFVLAAMVTLCIFILKKLMIHQPNKT